MNNMEIQREAIIEIVGTQYEDRAANHLPQNLRKGLVLKHQSDNPHDANAVLLLTEDGKELGFLPKGYASLYAPAIDSGRYCFKIEVEKAEYDVKRPILIVKIISELASRREEDIESDILGLVQNLADGYALRKKEYLTFISADKVNVDELLSALDKARFMRKLVLRAGEIVKSRAVKPVADNFVPFSEDSEISRISGLRADVRDVLKKIQKAYDESIDIEDEEEYLRVQSKIRETRKNFRQYDVFLASLLDALTTNNKKSAIRPSASADAKIVAPIRSQLTEKAFLDRLMTEGGVSRTTAKQYISSIHSIERLYESLFGERKNILGAASADNAKATIEKLVERNEYIEEDKQRHGIFGISLNKFAKFADISVEGLENPTDKKKQQPDSGRQYVVKTVDFENPYNYTNYKPCSFVFNGARYPVENWRAVYKKFLVLLYNNNTYSEIIKGLNGKSLVGHSVDFVDKTHSAELRRPIKITENIVAEGNLSTVDIIRRIKRLMELCSIDGEHMIIEYSTLENADDASAENGDVKQVDLIADNYNSDENTANFCNTNSENSFLDSLVKTNTGGSGDNSSFASDITELFYWNTATDEPPQFVIDKPPEAETKESRVVLKLGGNEFGPFNYSDALSKVCEFSINCKPFEMARIAQEIQLRGKSVFYRGNAPVDGYSKLSNGLQITGVFALSDLQEITAAIKNYCRIDDELIKIISREEIYNG